MRGERRREENENGEGKHTQGNILKHKKMMIIERSAFE